METLKQLDIVVVVYVTDHIDVSTTFVYGSSNLSDEEVVILAYECVLECHPQGDDAMDGWEVLNITR
jgi:hypothetical protein